ncbi:unnamed protein product [Kuraishia capsulata CBS 1993]|uniref:SURF1-like protein n=1 Tax=Kuraishia capsulata CBS 1993 TaxID=1382522 RepID=W6MU37_9ASCO|nr:uncharacterized protein KUCA_T00004837001 [Kuraishia capsulata CBS 1993]CDK28852.1 unnamed protein product [Kuraishia capsulata CBS 1993]
MLKVFTLNTGKSIFGTSALRQRRWGSVKTDNIDWKPFKSEKQLTSHSSTKRGSKSRNVVLGLLCLTPVVTLGLGIWQVQRLKWKNKLVAECEDRLTYSPLPLPKSITAADVPNFEYRKVSLKGRFDYDHEMFVGPRLNDGQKGYLLVTPFIRSSGGEKVLVERGWISDDKVVKEDRNLQHLSCPEGEIEIVGLLKVPPVKGMFHIDHDVGARLFHYVDVNAMADFSGSGKVYVQAIEDFRDHPEWQHEATEQPKGEKPSGWKLWGNKDTKETSAAKPVKLSDDSSEVFDPNQFRRAGVPLGKEPKIDYKNNHFQYVVTWLGLSFASAILLFLTLRKGKFVDPTKEKLKHASRFN